MYSEQGLSSMLQAVYSLWLKFPWLFRSLQGMQDRLQVSDFFFILLKFFVFFFFQKVIAFNFILSVLCFLLATLKFQSSILMTDKLEFLERRREIRIEFHFSTHECLVSPNLLLKRLTFFHQLKFSIFVQHRYLELCAYMSKYSSIPWFMYLLNHTICFLDAPVKLKIRYCDSSYINLCD